MKASFPLARQIFDQILRESFLVLAYDSTQRRLGKLKQDNHMKTLSKWLLAASLSIISFLILVKLFTEITELSRIDTTQVCLEVSCL